VTGDAPPGLLRRLFPRRIRFVPQLSPDDCGAACLTMVLRLMGRETDLTLVHQRLEQQSQGASAEMLIRAAADFGLVLRGLRVELNTLALLPRGTILHWNFNHFVVLDRARPDWLSIADPACGLRRVPLDEVDQRFTGVALVPERLVPGAGPARRAADAVPAGASPRLVTAPRRLVAAAVTSLTLQFLLMVYPLLTGLITTAVVRGQSTALGGLPVAAGFMGAALFFGALLRARLLHTVTRLSDADAVRLLLDRMLRLPWRFFTRQRTGEALARISTLVRIREAINNGLITGVSDGLTCLFYLVLLAFTRWGFVLAVLGCAAAQVIVLLGTSASRRGLAARQILADTALHAYEGEMFMGIESIKSMGALAPVTARWNDLYRATMVPALAQARLDAFMEAFTALLRLACPMLVLLLAAASVQSGQLQVGQLVSSCVMAAAFFGSFTPLVALLGRKQELQPHLPRVTEVFQSAPEPSGSRPLTAMPRQIRVEDLTFRYAAAEPPVLQGVSFSIGAGELVAIVGASGSGKSTLLRVLLGLLEPSEGRVLLDDVDLRDVDRQDWRSRLGVVVQSSPVLGLTVRENISLLRPGATLEEIRSAARVACIHDDIMAMPLGYDTALLGAASRLSGGQRQRIALARVLLGRPSMLVLDEPTSALDALTEERVLGNVMAMQITRVIVAHRLSTVRNADRIIVLRNGRKVEEGRHRELVERRGHYRELVGVRDDAEEEAAS